jgi:hypothetical protein
VKEVMVDVGDLWRGQVFLECGAGLGRRARQG